MKFILEELRNRVSKSFPVGSWHRKIGERFGFGKKNKPKVIV